MNLKHFKIEEFACKGKDCCGRSHPMNPDVLRQIDLIRERFGSPLIISSGFRCHVHNERIGGVSQSLHTLGLAVDLKPVGRTSYELYETLLDWFGRGGKGIGIYDTFLHVDFRGFVGRPFAFWDKRNDK